MTFGSGRQKRQTRTSFLILKSQRSSNTTNGIQSPSSAWYVAIHTYERQPSRLVNHNCKDGQQLEPAEGRSFYFHAPSKPSLTEWLISRPKFPVSVASTTCWSSTLKSCRERPQTRASERVRVSSSARKRKRRKVYPFRFAARTPMLKGIFWNICLKASKDKGEQHAYIAVLSDPAVVLLPQVGHARPHQGPPVIDHVVALQNRLAGDQPPAVNARLAKRQPRFLRRLHGAQKNVGDLTVLQIVGWNTIRNGQRYNCADVKRNFSTGRQKRDRNLIKTRSARLAWSGLALMHDRVGSEAGAAF
jgi:hypothetical protein